MNQLATSTKSFTVAHEIEAVDSHPDENRSKADGIHQLEPAYNGKISMRSPSSNATVLLTLAFVMVLIRLVTNKKVDAVERHDE